jgi:pyruvate formate lyase activating enzyme
MYSGVVLSPSGMVVNIQPFSIHDGPGLRTTVFLKGCSLQCYGCHNPESIGAMPEILFFPARCIGCGPVFRLAAIAGQDGTIDISA